MAFPPSILTRLPQKLCLSGHDIIIDRFQAQQIPEAHRLVCAEAARGHDVGQDEFPSETQLRGHIEHAHSFSVTDAHTGALLAWLTLAPSAYSRMSVPLLADGVVICDVEIKARIIQALIQVALQLAAELGYEVVLADVFSTSDLVARLRAEGFTVIGCIPNSGHLRYRGWTDSLVMMKDIKTQTPRGRWHSGIDLRPQFVSSSRDAAAPSSRSGEEANQAMAPLKYLTQKPANRNLPREHSFRSGTAVRLRYMEDGDLDKVYAMYRGAAQRGNGFSTDEFLTLDVFRFNVVDHAHSIVGEDVVTSEIVLASSVLPCMLCRSVDPQLADPYLVVNPLYQRKGLGEEVSSLVINFIQELGYTGVLADCLADNTAICKILQRRGFTVVGYIPKAAKSKNQKMADMLLLYKELNGMSDLSKL